MGPRAGGEGWIIVDLVDVFSGVGSVAFELLKTLAVEWAPDLLVSK